ncbi:hypothetical protein Tsubulata_049369 [Turnera subulata]|uniref:Uncharacterized protein n=1 Tax=Turnera subulata TaxID=218843 RepID=A0A9Q0JBS2_9ROSI|nr:hypothetical protein Tsubulata_049369 [Turnera subulata]
MFHSQMVLGFQKRIKGSITSQRQNYPPHSSSSPDPRTQTPNLHSSFSSINLFSTLATAALPSLVATATSSLVQTLWRFIKKPWEITGACASPEYLSTVPDATEYRVECLPPPRSSPSSPPPTLKTKIH